MPDSKAGSWAAIGGQEIVNAQRTISYIHNFGLPITVDEDCWCPSIQELLGSDCGPATGYAFPSTDPAPWYDPTEPESGDFLGFLTTEFDGLGSTFTRNTFETLQGGAILGRLRPQARTMTWKGYLFGRTCCAAEYGLRWLTSVLAAAGGCDGCDGAELDILLCCPEPSGTVNIGKACNVAPVTSCSTKQSIGLSPPLGVNFRNQDAFRTFYRTGLIDGPKVTNRRTLGCGGDCEDGPGCLIEAEFSIVAGNPFMHRDTKHVCVDQPFPSCDATCDPADPVWEKIGTTAYPANTADGATCLDSLDCTVLDGSVNCILDPDCPTASLPVFPPFEDACGCEAFWTTRFCCSVDNREPADPSKGAQSAYGKFFEGIPTVTIYSGSQKLKNVVVSFYENPQQRTCADKDIFQSDCFRCAQLLIRYIPPNTTFTLDGLTKRVTAECIGRDDPVAAESNTVSPFNWPVLKCISYLITVDADCSFGVAPDATVCVSITPREM